VTKLKTVPAAARQELKERREPPLVGFELGRQLKVNGNRFFLQK
jgi:hypothetical protein